MADRSRYQWCPLREGRVALKTCRHQALAQGDPTCLQCLQQDLFAAKPERRARRSVRRGS